MAYRVASAERAATVERPHNTPEWRYRWLRRSLMATDAETGLELATDLKRYTQRLDNSGETPGRKLERVERWMAERDVLVVGEALIDHLTGNAAGQSPDYLPGAFPSLGWLVADFVERWAVVPDRHVMGQPFIHADWQLNHLLRFYRLREGVEVDYNRPAAPFVYNGSVLVRPQKMGKGPFSGGRILGQALGPCLFDGWSRGWPIGRPHPKPIIQVVAVSEDQTNNIWRSLRDMIKEGPLSDHIEALGDHVDLPSGGIIERVSSAALSRQGALVAYAVFDEGQNWLGKATHLLSDTMRRGVAGMGGRYEMNGNAYDPNERSVLQADIESPRPDVFVDYPPPLGGSWRNRQERRRILKHAYADTPWIDIERIEEECDGLAAKNEAQQAERWYGNRIVAGADRAWDIERFKLLRDREHDCVEPGRLVTGGFDGALTKDSTGYAIVDVELGRIQIVNVWERPDHMKDEDGWEVPIGELNDTVALVHDRWDVWRGHYDPPHYREDLNRWAGEHGEDLVVAWETARKKAMGYALRNFTRDMEASARAVKKGEPPIMTYVGEHADVLERHVANAVKRMTNIRVDDDAETDEFLWIIGKDGKNSPRKIDLAMCVVLAWEARGLAIASGALNKPNYARAAW